MLKRLAGALAALVLVWVLISVWRRSERDEPGSLAMASLDTARVSRVALRRPADSIVAERESGGWKVNGLPASAEYLSGFLAAFGDTARRTELVATSSGSHARLGVDSAAGRRLTIEVGDSAVADLVLGNRGPDFEGTYVRATGDTAVYLLHSRLADLLLDGLDSWRERRILALPMDSIAGVRVTVGRAGWELSRKGAGWEVNRSAADSVKVRRYLAQFEDLRASGFPDPSNPVPDFDHPIRTVTVTTGSGAPGPGLEFVDAGGGAFWVRVGGGDLVYRLAAQAVEGMAPPAPELSP
jgi:hypothetical protein